MPAIVGSVLAFVSAFAIFFIGRHMNVFDKTKQQSTVATFNIGNVQEDVKEMKKLHEDLKAFIEKRLDKLEDNNRQEFRRAFERIDILDSSMVLVKYRLDRLDRENGRTS